MFEFENDFEPNMPIVLLRKLAPRIAPDNPDVVEVQCEFEQLGTSHKKTVWLPLPEVIAWPLGYVVKRGIFDIDGLPLMKIKTPRFVARRSATSEHMAYSHFGMSPTGDASASQSLREADFWIDGERSPPIVIPKNEYTRFVLSAFGSFVPHLLDLDIDPDAVFARFCDPDSVRLDRNCFHVKMRGDMVGRSTALEIAVLKTETSYLDALRRFGRALRLSIVNQHVLPDIPQPHESLNLVLGVENRIPELYASPTFRGYPDAIVVSRVLADRRKLKFKQLVMETPFAFTPADPHPPDQDPEHDQEPPPPGGKRTKFAKRLEIDRNERPGRRARRLNLSSGSLFSIIPALRDVRCDERPARTLHRPPGQRRDPEKAKVIDRVSPLPPIGKNPIGRLQHNPTVPRTPPVDPPQNSERQTRFFEDETTPAIPIVVEFEPLDDLAKPFVRTASMLDIWNSINLSLSSAAHSEPAQVRAFEWTRAHGKWGWSTKHNRGRRVFVHTLILDKISVLVAEIERLKSNEKFSIGLIWRSEPVRSIAEIAKIVGQLGTRNSGVHDPGTWPPHSFEDVRFAKIIHAGGRDVPNVLASAIIDRALELTGSRSKT